MGEHIELTVSAGTYTLGCGACRQLTPVPGAANRFICSGCKKHLFLLTCQRCHGSNVVLGSGRREPVSWTCDWCLVSNFNSGMGRLKRESSTAKDAWEALDRHGITSGDPDIRVLGGFELLHGYGDIPPTGTLCSICALADGVAVVADLGATGQITIPYTNILNLDVGGHGVITRNAGMIGGGVGLRGAATGIAVASLINNATRKTTVDSFLRISCTDTEMLFSHWKLPPAAIRNALGRMFVKQMAATHPNHSQPTAPPTTATAPPAAEPGPLDVLERLTKLHAAGTLSDTEFELARSTQIRRLHNPQS